MRFVAFQWYSIMYFMAEIKHKEFPFEALCKTSVTKKRKKISKFRICYFDFSDTLATA